MKLTVETVVDTDLDKAWSAYNSPEDIVRWNAASDDWHSPRSEEELREGCTFCTRMEAKDGSTGFDFGSTYPPVVQHELDAYRLGRLAFAAQRGGPARGRHLLHPHGSEGRQHGLRFRRHLHPGHPAGTGRLSPRRRPRGDRAFQPGARRRARPRRVRRRDHEPAGNAAAGLAGDPRQLRTLRRRQGIMPAPRAPRIHP